VGLRPVGHELSDWLRSIVLQHHRDRRDADGGEADEDQLRALAEDAGCRRRQVGSSERVKVVGHF